MNRLIGLYRQSKSSEILILSQSATSEQRGSMMKRMGWITPVIVGGLVLGAVAPATAATETQLPGAPGCAVDKFTADHATGGVGWTITCEEDRDVVVDATAFQGTPDDHEIVEERSSQHRVRAGESWTSSVRFDTDEIDQIRAQAVSFVDIGDVTELPAIIGGTQG